MITNIFRIPYYVIRPLYERTSFHKSVIEDLQDDQLKGAYSHCRGITKKHAKTFYMATRFLPNEKQRGIFAIYGLCRYLDDLVDEAEDLIHDQKITVDQVDEKLEMFKQRLIDVYDGRIVDDPILTAFSDTLKKYQISMDLPFLLMDGVKTDLVKSRFKDFEEVYDYSYKVASVVGLMTSEVFGYVDDKALDYAVDLGIAMQLTNILRDIGEDLRRGRIYIPQNELDEFGIKEDELFSYTLDEKFKSLMEFQINRAREYYAKADKGIALLSSDSRLPVYLARHNYGRILDKIEQNDYNVFDHRAYLNYTEKLSILPKAFIDLNTAG
ncbi:phytoene/squalene synthase family protein [Gracilimonas sediminicola]|uniref:Squalene/phytoene synthase family protein n=1 Tax=Gracilimonas sediminicola TaxID=2952158 RepID=A0A9X2RGW0_9BACT|nr:squalene/phytoene synthase family protein [Gracilimonas sediminicola]MCP9292647.1 squalene/phytoene synthase family protein [Gracilimonas sediminicola]